MNADNPRNTKSGCTHQLSARRVCPKRARTSGTSISDIEPPILFLQRLPRSACERPARLRCRTRRAATPRHPRGPQYGTVLEPPVRRLATRVCVATGGLCKDAFFYPEE